MWMPVIDGDEAAQRIKASTKGQATAIVALTASAFEEERAIVLDAGCDDFLRNPFRGADIFNMMHKHIGVRYIYAEPPPELPEPNEHHGSVAPAALAVIPPELLFQFEKAVKYIDLKSIDNLIGEIGDYDADLVAGLKQLAHEFKTDELLELIKEAKEIRDGESGIRLK